MAASVEDPAKDLIRLVKDSVFLLRPLSKKEKFNVERVKEYVGSKDFKTITVLLKQKKIKLSAKKYGFSFMISGKDLLPYFESEDLEVDKINKKIEKKFFSEIFKEFSTRAYDVIPQYIGPNIIGSNAIKKAVALQLASKEPIHLLLIGDPGTGKTDIIRSAKNLAKVSSFGLGSGTSGAGLSVTVKGKKIMPGLLPLADKGVCCIDELNLMKKDDRASLYNAMEKGFVSYDKGGQHSKFYARIKLLATANPLKDRFKNYKLKTIKKQMPFDDALLSRFHLIFFVRKAGLDAFENIAEQIIIDSEKKVNSHDIHFIKRYLSHIEGLDVKVPKHLSTKIKQFVTNLKKHEKTLPYEITPRMVKGVMEMIKASARLENRNEVETKDLSRVFDIINNSIELEDQN